MALRWFIVILLVILLCGCVPGDANGDRCVDYRDLALLATAYGARWGDARFDWRVDFNWDGRIDGADLDILSAHYREGCR